MGKFAKGEENSILIIDNASIHNHMEIRNLIEEAGGIVIFHGAIFSGFKSLYYHVCLHLCFHLFFVFYDDD